MEKVTIVVNTGSASKKYAIYRGAETPYALFRLEHRNNGFFISVTSGAHIEERTLSTEEYRDAFLYVISKSRALGVMIDQNLSVVGVRIVAPGTFFTEHKLIDSEYRAKLEQAEKIAPLHIRQVLDELAQITHILPNVKIVGVSDSAFHATMPAHARTYGLPLDEARELDIYRFGYHGLSTTMAIQSLTNIPERVIVCHLGGGSSVTAVKNGISIDTSMGYTPLEGIIGGTRVGSIDAGAVIRLTKLSDFSVANHLNTQSGLLGVSGQSADIRVLLDLEAKGDENAHRALNLYVYQIQKHIGSFVAILGGIDALVFTGTIGERSSIIRTRICAALNHLGIILDTECDNATIEQFSDIGSTKAGTARIIVIPSREMDMIARATALCTSDCT